MTEARARWQEPRPRRLDKYEPEASLLGIVLAALAAVAVVVIAVVATEGNRIAEALVVAVAIAVAVPTVARVYRRLSARRDQIVQVRRPTASILWWIFRHVAPNVVALGLLMQLGRDGRALLAEELAGPNADFDELVTAATTSPHERTRSQADAWAKVGPLGRMLLARALYLHGDGDADRVAAAAIYRELEVTPPPLTPRLPRGLPGVVRWLQSFIPSHRLLNHDRLYLAELQFLLGRREEAAETIRRSPRSMDAYRRLEADLVNPFRPGGDMDAWLALVNRPFRSGEFAPIEVADGTEVPFERLASHASRVVDTGPVVTVVVSSYKPGDALAAAVRSVLASTWHNLEVLVVDDASPKGSEATYKTVANLDPRVRVERLKKNGGTYACRNYALDNAAGELITFHDSDDWMHPERIERQVAHLLANDRVLANTTASVRVTPDLLFTHYRTPIGKACEPSLLFRREEMRDLVGYFDTVRKAADSEYRFRIARATGTPVPTLSAVPLTFQRVDAGSLSGDEIHRDWIHVSRRLYRACFEHWHASTTSPRTAADGPRAFYAPPRLRGDDAPAAVDVVIAVPYALPMRSSAVVHGVGATVDAALAAGRSVALWPIETPWRREGRLPDMSKAWAELLNAHRDLIEAVLPGDVVKAGTLVVADAAVGEYRSPDSAKVSASDVVLLGDEPGRSTLGGLAALVGGTPTVRFGTSWADVPSMVTGE